MPLLCHTTHFATANRFLESSFHSVERSSYRRRLFDWIAKQYIML